MAEWTKEARAELTPRRGEVKRRALPYDAEALFAAMRDAWGDGPPKFERGVAKGAPPAAVEALARVKAFFRHAMPETPIDPEAQGLALRALGVVLPWPAGAGVHRDLARHWMARGGLDVAVRAIVAWSRWDIGFAVGGGADAWEAPWLAPRAPDLSFGRGHLKEAAAELTEAIASASDADYAAVVAVVRELRAELGAGVRLRLTALVSDQAEWAHEDVRALLAEAEVSAHREGWIVREAASLLFMVTDADLAERLFVALRPCGIWALAQYAHDAARVLGERALPTLLGVLDDLADQGAKAEGLGEARKIARAAALFRADAVAASFARWVHQPKSIGPVATAWFEANPERAARALGGALLEKTRRAEPARELLARIARTSPDAIRAGSASLPGDVAAALDRLVASTGAEAAREEAPMDALPLVLRAPPWRSKSRTTLPVLSGLAAPPRDARVPALSDAARDAPWNAKQLADLADHVARLKGADARSARAFRIWSPWRSLPDAVAIAVWTEVPPAARYPQIGEVPHMLARFGAAALPGAALTADHAPTRENVDPLLGCDAPDVAWVMVRAIKKGTRRPQAIAWLDAHVETAVHGLLPIALGAPSPRKLPAAVALRGMADRGRADAVLAASRAFGPEAARAAEAALAFDPRFDCPAAPPKLPPYADPDALPPVWLTGGRALPRDAVRNLLEMLQLTPLDPAYVGIDDVIPRLDRASTDAFLRSLLDAWIAAGASSAGAWPLRAIAHLGSPALADELATRIPRWLREKGRPRALLAVDVLGAMDHDLALLRLSDLARTAKNPQVEARAAEVLADVAEARGLSQDELDDRLTPTLGLAPDGSTTLDFGPRQIVGRVDDRLALVLYDGATQLPRLPRAAKTDDAELAKAATARAKALAAELEAVAKSLTARLEAAMIAGRRWSAPDWTRFLRDHPLAGRFARRLAWTAHPDGAEGAITARAFRVAEDGSLADDQDRALELGPDDQVALPHPLALDADTRARLTELFADYRILQPFEQLGRATAALPSEDRDRQDLPRLAGRAVPAGALLGRLEARGFRRDVGGEGAVDSLSKSYGGHAVSVTIDPYVYLREKLPESLTITHVRSTTALGQLSPVAYSELVYDLGALVR